MFDDAHPDPSGFRAQMVNIFLPQNTLRLSIRFESALAQVQGQLGLIPEHMAQAITDAAKANAVSVADVQVAQAQVGHPMVAILNAFTKHLSPDAAEWLHFGATTADVVRTVRVMQMHQVCEVTIKELNLLKAKIAQIAADHADTPMVGRTLGRHAMPITFGYKLCVWLDEIERCIQRFNEWQTRYPSGVLSGAVGTHAAMGESGPQVQALVMKELGLGAPAIIDAKGSMDVFVDLGSAQAIMARVLGRMAQEIFLLQGDDIRELSLESQDVGSSTMPHKSNPTLCIDVMSRSREVAASLPVLLEWIWVIFERDSTMHGNVLEDMCIRSAQVLSCMCGVVDRLRVHPKQMAENLARTNGAVLAESVTVRLAETMGRRSAYKLAHEATENMMAHGISFEDALAQDIRTRGVNLPLLQEAYGLAPQLVAQALNEHIT